MSESTAMAFSKHFDVLSRGAVMSHTRRRSLPALLAVLATVCGFTAAADAAAPTAAHGEPAHRAARPAPDVGFPPDSYAVGRPGPNRFPLVAHGGAAALFVDGGDYAGVRRAASDLRSDLHRVTGLAPTLHTGDVPRNQDVVLIGTIGHSERIDRLIRSGRLDVRGIVGKWETSLETVVRAPLPGVRRAFVIAGSDQRGTIYGTYDLSRAIGVSPWYWWDDVPAQHHDAIYVRPGRHSQGTPAVKHRGFFINDENPQTGTWAPKIFGPGLAPGYPGGLNHKCYAKVFELALRLKANYIWPAVWGRAFALDDPQNEATATRYGIVMGTSHEAPMTCGIEEWNRFAVPAVRESKRQKLHPPGLHHLPPDAGGGRGRSRV